MVVSRAGDSEFQEISGRTAGFNLAAERCIGRGHIRNAQLRIAYVGAEDTSLRSIEFHPAAANLQISRYILYSWPSRNMIQGYAEGFRIQPENAIFIVVEGKLRQIALEMKPGIERSFLNYGFMKPVRRATACLCWNVAHQIARVGTR